MNRTKVILAGRAARRASSADERTFLSVEQTALRLRRNPQLIRRWIRDGRLEAVAIGPVYAISEATLKRFTPPPARRKVSA